MYRTDGHTDTHTVHYYIDWGHRPTDIDILDKIGEKGRKSVKMGCKRFRNGGQLQRDKKKPNISNGTNRKSYNAMVIFLNF